MVLEGHLPVGFLDLIISRPFDNSKYLKSTIRDGLLFMKSQMCNTIVAIAQGMGQARWLSKLSWTPQRAPWTAQVVSWETCKEEIIFTVKEIEFMYIYIIIYIYSWFEEGACVQGCVRPLFV